MSTPRPWRISAATVLALALVALIPAPAAAASRGEYTYIGGVACMRQYSSLEVDEYGYLDVRNNVQSRQHGTTDCSSQNPQPAGQIEHGYVLFRWTGSDWVEHARSLLQTSTTSTWRMSLRQTNIVPSQKWYNARHYSRILFGDTWRVGALNSGNVYLN